MKSKLLMRVAIIFVCTFAVLTSLICCKQAEKSAEKGQHKIVVITTIFPLYDMAGYIGGDKADVSLLLPPGVEPHAFEPKPADAVKINKADVFVYTGKFMEPWTENIIKGITNRTLLVIDASQGTKMIPAVLHDSDEPAGSLDPHIWLDFDNAKAMVGSIVNALQAKDSANSSYYEQKARDYNNKLSELDSSFKKTLATCKSKEIIYGGHYAFGYLAKRYGLKYIAAQGISPDAEPTANDMANLVKQIRKDKIKYIYYEELTSPKIAETLAQETHVKLLSLNAAHNITRDQLVHSISFFDILQSDLDNIKVGLECQ
jgi:zinc transport system substrate-binding protein